MLKAPSFPMVKGGDRLGGSIPDDKSSDVEADESEDEEQLSFGEAGHSNCSSLFDAVFAWSYSGGRHDGSLWILRCSVSLNRCNRSSQLCWNSCRSLIKLISALWLVKYIKLNLYQIIWSLTKGNHIFLQRVVALINTIYDSSPQ